MLGALRARRQTKRATLFSVLSLLAGCGAESTSHVRPRTTTAREVRRLERDTGLPVRYVISPGGGHHLHMAPGTPPSRKRGPLLPRARADDRQRSQAARPST